MNSSCEIDDKKIWEWIIETKSKKDIVNLANVMKIPGFRIITDEIPIKIVTGKLIERVNKPLSKQTRERYDEKFKEMIKFRGKSKAELSKIIENEGKLNQIIEALLTSDNVNDRLIASEIFSTFSLSGKTGDYINSVNSEIKDRPKESCVGNDEVKLGEKRIKELEKSISMYKTKIQSLETTQRRQEKEFDRRYELLKKKNEMLQGEINRLVNEKNNYEIETINNLKIKSKEEACAQKEIENKISVILIGKLPEGCSGILSSYEVKMVDEILIRSNQIAQMIEEIDEVWMMLYETPITIIKKVKQNVGDSRLREFSTYNEFIKYIKQGAIK